MVTEVREQPRVMWVIRHSEGSQRLGVALGFSSKDVFGELCVTVGTEVAVS